MAILLQAKLLILLIFLASCATPYVDSNPRNMQNMTPDQIERALAGE